MYILRQGNVLNQSLVGSALTLTQLLPTILKSKMCKIIYCYLLLCQDSLESNEFCMTAMRKHRSEQVCLKDSLIRETLFTNLV